MEEWKSYKLGEISTIQTGPFGSQLHQSDYVESGVPCIMPTNIGRMLDFQLADIAHITEDDACKLSRHIVHEGDIVYSRRGDIEKCAYVSPEQDGWFCGTGCLKITINPNLAVPKFVAYLLSTTEIKSWIVGNAVGTTMLNLNTAVLSDVPLSLPSLQTQKRCVRILDSLESKISLNNRINHNLEEQAQALYKSWFVDFEPFRDGEFVDSDLGLIPVGWRSMRAEDICPINIGKTPPRKESEWFSANKDDYTWVSISDMSDCGTYIDSSSETLTHEAIRKFNIAIVPAGSVLLSFKLTIGRVAIANKELTTNEAIARFVTNSPALTNYLYLALKNYDYSKLGSTSSIAIAVNSKIIKAMPLVYPGRDVVNKFAGIVAGLFEEIKKRQRENKVLAEIRNSALPRLMSGDSLPYLNC